MFVVLFEVQPYPEQFERYLELAKQLKPKLQQVRGFIDNERYESERTSGRLLSLSSWQDEKALVRWRTDGEHHDVQRQGRFEVFEDYRIRIGEVIQDTDSADLPQTRLDTTTVTDAIAATITEVDPGVDAPPDPGGDDLADAEWYTGINTEGKRVLLASWRSDEAAGAWLGEHPDYVRCRHVRIIRNYGLNEREEAPQYYPPVETGAAA